MRDRLVQRTDLRKKEARSCERALEELIKSILKGYAYAYST